MAPVMPLLQFDPNPIAETKRMEASLYLKGMGNDVGSSFESSSLQLATFDEEVRVEVTWIWCPRGCFVSILSRLEKDILYQPVTILHVVKGSSTRTSRLLDPPEILCIGRGIWFDRVRPIRAGASLRSPDGCGQLVPTQAPSGKRPRSGRVERVVSTRRPLLECLANPG